MTAMTAMTPFSLAILLPCFHSSFASQAMSVMKISSSGNAFEEHLAQNIHEAQSLLTDDSHDDQPSFFGTNSGNFGPGLPANMGPPLMASQKMAQAAPMGKVDFDLTAFQMSLPLDTGIRLESDDGVWFSSKAKSRDDKNYDTNSVLSIPLKIYDKITGSG
mmetsp:Transcript_83052/g.131373  ORF Transcript_83052/g.131373 Transcript_83052/m.131373 type:complete len:161 (-) Transcript_83052:131-613(-)